MTIFKLFILILSFLLFINLSLIVHAQCTTDCNLVGHCGDCICDPGEDCISCSSDCSVSVSCGSCGGTTLCDGSCSIPTPANFGQSCGSCGGTIQCDGTCSITTPPSFGQSCESCGGTINCNNLCSKPNPSNFLQPCTNIAPPGTNPGCGNGQCGDYFNNYTIPGGLAACDDWGCSYYPDTLQTDTYNENCNTCPQDCGQCPDKCNAFDCNGNCNFNGFCSTPGSTQCLNGRHQSCDSNANFCWVNDGIDADKDGVDKECGDSLCDNAPYVFDSTKTATETNCGDGLDNDCNGLADCADSACQNQPPCCTTITRNCKEYTEQEFEKTHHGHFRIEGAIIQCDLDQATCDKISSEIVNSRFFACPPNYADTICCPNPSSCVFNGVCYPDGTKFDIDGDIEPEVCVAHSPGQWIAGFEFDCTNGIDDDANGLVDCADPDCNGSINGTVKAQDNQLVAGADVSAKKDLTTVQTSTTDQNGIYKFTSINCGPYNLAVSAANFAPRTQFINLTSHATLTANFALVLGTSCENDCTFVADNTIHASCDGLNGCTFFDSTAKSVCDNAQPGWLRDYDANNYVVCAPGSLQPKIETRASISCSSGTLVKVTRIVVYNGKPVKLVVATCG